MQRYLAEGKSAAVAAEMVASRRLTVHMGAAARMDAGDVRLAHAELRAALDRYQETAAQRVLERLFVSHARVAVIRDALLPYLRDTGERWARAHVSVAQEHFTSGFLEARFMAMARGWDRGAGGHALLACPSGERHTFGLVAFGIALHDLGWRITYLGADTPVDMVDQAAQQIAPDLVVIAAAMPNRLTSDDTALRGLARRWVCALGGAGVDPATSATVGARHLAGDPVSAAANVANL
jgi:MerR family transcriptional regulator, light-induced transcriptional regulator